MFGFILNPAQSESIAQLTKELGAGQVDGFNNPRDEGVILFTDREGGEHIVATDGAVYHHTIENVERVA